MSLTVSDQQRNLLGERLAKARQRALQPPPRLTLSQWSEEHMWLSPESSSLPGRFKFHRAEFQRGMMDALTDDRYKKVVIMASSQIAKSQVLLNFIGYIIHLSPAPTLLVQPTQKLADTFSRDRIDTLLRDVPALKGRVKDKRQRDSGNKVSHKVFPGGSLSIVTSGSATDLSSRPIKYLLLDEVDRMVPLATEGDPISIAYARTATYHDSKTVLVSSPTDEEVSRINAEYKASDQRIFMVPCNSCGVEQKLEWSQVQWQENQPKTAEYVCAHCGERWNDSQKNANVQRGRWVITNPESDVAGFWINSIYSSFIKLGDLATQFITAKRNGAEELRVFLNTKLGVCFKNDAVTVAQQNWISRLEDYTPDRIPNKIGLITAGVDVQIDRLEVEVVGWGIGDESWSLEYLVLMGDPNSPNPWLQMDQLLAKEYTRQDGLKLRINATCCDLGGTGTQSVFEYAKKNANRNFFGIKGQAGQGKPLWAKKFKRWVTGQRFYPVGVDTAKERLYSQLQIQSPGPGYCHFPLDRTEQYFEGLTSETYKIQYRRGFPIKTWTRKNSIPNEPLDTRCYAMAARASFNLNMEKRLEALDKKAKELATAVIEKTPVADPVPSILPPEQRPPTLAKKPFAQIRPQGGMKGWINSLG